MKHLKIGQDGDPLVQIPGGMWINPRNIILVNVSKNQRGFVVADETYHATLFIELRQGGSWRVPFFDDLDAEETRDELAALTNGRKRHATEVHKKRMAEEAPASAMAA